ncbi:UDP-N-acetylmuramate--L-alanine ligase [Olivibacter sitiensis]|uniref:UDP-N-acetylmuramate--L-alanine ligase n=1 Tax=Olivibacter sitiensis TaxID=376470 RepID=UPI0003FC581F|nr:Mur ligase family protein [Olivibacter sitiensis]
MRVHFIAIGGAVMHNLAIALAQKGYIVTGSDDFIYEPSKSNLEAYGLLPKEIGWHPELIDQSIDAVVLGMHAKADNPELLKAQELDLRIYSYPEFVYEQTQDKLRVVVAGSHGKTTITSMIMHVLKKLNREFDYLVGAKLEGFDTMVRLTKDAPLIIVEGDEYLASPIDKRPKFLLYHANIALISGIAWDHINVFPTYDDYVEQFRLFIQSISPKGTLVYNKDDKEVQKLVNENNAKINTHGYRLPSYTINKGVTYLQTNQGDIPLQVFGRHNLSNLAGAYTVCEWLGITRDDFYDAIKTFNGAVRRLEYVADKDGSIVYKDFAHSPSKVRASVEALSEQYPDKELIAVVELHTFSSLDDQFLAQYKDAMAAAETAAVFIDEKSLKQKNKKPIDPLILKQSFNREDLLFFNSAEDLLIYLRNLDYHNKNLLFMSSGNFGGVNFVKYIDNFFEN